MSDVFVIKTSHDGTGVMTTQHWPEFVYELKELMSSSPIGTPITVARVGTEQSAHDEHAYELPPNLGCQLPPPGWWCSREPGHDGPCAAREDEPHPDVALTSAYRVLAKKVEQIDSLEAAIWRRDERIAELEYLLTEAVKLMQPSSDNEFLDRLAARTTQRSPQPCPAKFCLNGWRTDATTEAGDDIPCATCGGRGAVDADRTHGLVEHDGPAEWTTPPLFRLVDVADPEGAP